MFDSNDFLKLFQEGKVSPDTITKDFTDALNAALAAKKKADEEAAKQKAKEEAIRRHEELKARLEKEKEKVKAKMRDANDLAARITAFLKTHYADVIKNVDMSVITGESLVQVMDETMKILCEMNQAKARLTDLDKMFNNKDIDNKIKTVMDSFFNIPKDPIEAFLRSNHLL